MVDPLRLEVLHPAPLHPAGRYVLLWMVGNRRIGFNPALEHAVDRARELGRPLVVLEALRHDYPWATARSHHFGLAGMADLAPRFARAGVAHYRYVEPAPGAARGLLEGLAADACLVVTDLTPSFFFPSMRAAAARRISRRIEAVDGVGLLPVKVAGRGYLRAFDFRGMLARELPTHLGRRPRANPLTGDLPRVALDTPGLIDPRILARWAPSPPVPTLPTGLDTRVGPAAQPGGETAALTALARFLPHADGWIEDGRHPDRNRTSRLSPWLHWGHLSTWAVLEALENHASVDATFGLQAFPEPLAKFLDELVTWRELAQNGAAYLPHYDRYEGQPAWARATLEKHAADHRPVLYDPDALAGASTHDPLWNAAQRQLVEQGWMHNQLRMLWGKKVLEWSPSPAEGFATLLDLNNRYALDGRDPSSVAGVAWVFGRYDRAWGPERPIFGMVRYMTSASMQRKLEVKRIMAGAATPATPAWD